MDKEYYREILNLQDQIREACDDMELQDLDMVYIWEFSKIISELGWQTKYGLHDSPSENTLQIGVVEEFEDIKFVGACYPLTLEYHEYRVYSESVVKTPKFKQAMSKVNKHNRFNIVHSVEPYIDAPDESFVKTVYSGVLQEKSLSPEKLLIVLNSLKIFRARAKNSLREFEVGFMKTLF